MEKYNEEEWGGWKIVSDMLDKPDKNGIYPTSECYQKLYDFVVAQKVKAYKKGSEMMAVKIVEHFVKDPARKEELLKLIIKE